MSNFQAAYSAKMAKAWQNAQAFNERVEVGGEVMARLPFETRKVQTVGPAFALPSGCVYCEVIIVGQKTPHFVMPVANLDPLEGGKSW